jgi:hypothetical protein
VGRAVTRGLEPNLPLFWLLLVLLSVVVSFLWSTVNWYLSLAPLFVARDSSGSLRAMRAAAEVSRRRAGSFATVGLVFGALKEFAIVAAILVGLAPLSRSSLAAGKAWAVAVSLVYFALSDWLYVARLAAYMAIVEDEQQFQVSSFKFQDTQGLPSIVPGDEQLTPLHEAIEQKGGLT